MKEKYHHIPPQPGKHREYIGGEGDMWQKIGLLQFEFLKEKGLQPAKTFLDLACGSFRLGVHVIPYLQTGNYYGIDMHEWLITDGAQYELGEQLLTEKQPHFFVNETFDVNQFGVQFDYIMIQSLFTHLPLSKIENCFKKLPRVMHDAAQCFFTFFLLETKEQEIKIDEEPYHQPISFYEDVAKKNGLTFTYIGDWNHPRGQKIGLLTKM